MNTIITSTWDTIIQYFFLIFTVPTTEIFLNLINGRILCTFSKSCLASSVEPNTAGTRCFRHNDKKDGTIR
jgi:hypothetical protein